MKVIQAYSTRLDAMARQILLIVRGDPEGDMRRRLQAGCARCYLLASDRPTTARQTLHDLTEPPPQDYRWRYPFYLRVPDRRYFQQYASRKAVLARIAQGGLGIDDRLGPWNGSFWSGLKASGAIKKGPGTEWRVWERSRRELLADLEAMPLMHKLEPRAGKHGQRRLRRCYGPFLPPEDPTGRAVLAGLFAGAVLREVDSESWLELTDDQGVRAVLDDWGIPSRPLERPRGRRLVQVSPFYGVLVANLMPPHSAARMLSIRKAGGCPLLPAVLWKMAMSRRGQRRLPFSKALPFAVSRATVFRRGWNRLDLQKMGWLDLGIRITPRLRELMVEWHRRKSEERQPRPCGSSAA